MYITYFKYTNYPKRNIQKTKEAIKNIVAKKESRHNKGRKLLNKYKRHFPETEGQRSLQTKWA